MNVTIDKNDASKYILVKFRCVSFNYVNKVSFACTLKRLHFRYLICSTLNVKCFLVEIPKYLIQVLIFFIKSWDIHFENKEVGCVMFKLVLPQFCLSRQTPISIFLMKIFCIVSAKFRWSNIFLNFDLYHCNVYIDLYCLKSNNLFTGFNDKVKTFRHSKKKTHLL